MLFNIQDTPLPSIWTPDLPLELHIPSHRVTEIALLTDSGEFWIEINVEHGIVKIYRVTADWAVQAILSGIDMGETKLNRLRLVERDGAVSIHFNGQPVVVGSKDFRIADCIGIRTKQSAIVCWIPDIVAAPTWKAAVAPSGRPATYPTKDIEQRPPVPGLSLLVRAKNEERNVERCLNSVSDLVDEVIFVDNDSSDGTLSVAIRSQSKLFNVRIHQFRPKIPRVGADHARAVQSESSNTLGRYYNFTLSKARTYNVMKWDADFIAIRKNLDEMIDTFDLRRRGDPFALWFGGVSIWTDGEQYWQDRTALYNEFRCYSKLHGARWVDLPEWEELDQTYLFKAISLSFAKPVFAEIFHIDQEAYARRGINMADVRDKEKAEALKQFGLTGRLPEARFVPIAGIEQSVLEAMTLSERENEMRQYMVRRFSAQPRLRDRETGEIYVDAEQVEQASLAVLCITHGKNAAVQDTIRAGYGQDCRERGIPLYFVIGRPGEREGIYGDILFVDAPDSYEWLARKVFRAFQFIHRRTEIGHVLKVDDDVVLSIERFLRTGFWTHDVIGGGRSGGRDAIIDWHRGKCANDQLNEITVDPEGGTPWYGGGFTYCLSRKALEALSLHGESVVQTLYEDFAIWQALQHEELVDPSLPCYPTVGYSGWAEGEHRSAAVAIWDVPAEALKVVYDELRCMRDFYGPQSGLLAVETDWYDWDSFNAQRTN